MSDFVLLIHIDATNGVLEIFGIKNLLSVLHQPLPLHDTLTTQRGAVPRTKHNPILFVLSFVIIEEPERTDRDTG